MAKKEEAEELMAEALGADDIEPPNANIGQLQRMQEPWLQRGR